MFKWLKDIVDEPGVKSNYRDKIKHLADQYMLLDQRARELQDIVHLHDEQSKTDFFKAKEEKTEPNIELSKFESKDEFNPEIEEKNKKQKKSK
jgi:predicted nuclease with TOPRIM domain